MELKCFPLLCNRTQARIQRRRYPVGKKSGRRYHYRPTKRLIARLAVELKMSSNEVQRQIAMERLYLLRQIYGQNEIGLQDI